MSIFSSFEELEIEGESNGAIVLRDEQQEAIKRAANHFKSESDHRKFLWNAKMRFGKTICAMQLAKKMGVRTCLIVTHRPVVNKGWKEDFHKTFGDDQHYKYGTLFKDKDNDHSQNEGNFYELEKFSNIEGNHLVFFVSMQYLCLSQEVNTNSKNKGKTANENDKLKAAILNKEWDLVVIDEAHEGTRTSLGLRVIEMLSKPKTKVLHLSGTPFNLYQDFGASEIYTWDYIKEQRAKAYCETESWKSENPGKHNPYAGLPRMNIFTYDLANLLSSYRDQEQAFKFSEFFRTWSDKRHKGKIPPGKAGCFIHEDDVNNFLDLLCKESDETGYPFSTDAYRKNFRHTLWVVPGVSEAKALEDLLCKHKIFKNFKVINVAGNSEEDETRANALDKVLNEIGDRPDNRFTITISCGRLTTGVTVSPWTAVLYLKGSDNTSASTYLQTIFRVQSPWKFTSGGKKWMKTECFVFDFAPNRTLQMMAETAKFSVDTEEGDEKNKKQKQGKRPSNQDDKEKMKEFLNFCPVVAMEGGKMTNYNVDNLFAQLDRVYVDRVVRNGFNDNSLYNFQELLNLNPEALNRLQEIISKTSNLDKPKKASAINLTDNPRNAAKTKNGTEYGGDPKSTSEEDAQKKEERERRKKEREERDNRITILRGISLRIPLLIYGAELSDESAGITIENFTSIVDDASWAEFMPRGVSKEDFNSFKIAYNPTVFVESGKRIRALAREADSMPTDIRIQRIAEIFSYFHNPDKETVLTPWRVVNMHMSDCIGGFCFFNEKFDGPNQKEIIDETTGETSIIDTTEPRFVSKGTVTTNIFADYKRDTLSLNSKILEINSKTGLYPLYVAYSLFRFRSAHFVEANLIKNPQSLSIEEEQVIWDDIIRDNIFVICNTTMAKAITKRTLLGFRDIQFQPNIKSEKLIENAVANKHELIAKIKTVGYWKSNEKNDDQMKFNAVVGNPPYQDKKEATSDNPVYHLFMNLAYNLSDKAALITPGRFLFNAGKTPKEWNNKMLNDQHLKVVSYYSDSKDIFPGVEIMGGIVITLRDKKQKFEIIKNFSSHPEIQSIILKVKEKKFLPLSDLIYAPESYKFSKKLHELNPGISNNLSKGHLYDLTTNIFEKLPNIFQKEMPENSLEYIQIFGRENNNRLSKWIKRIYIEPHENLEHFKVLVPKSNGSGALGVVIPTALIGIPIVVGKKIGHNQSFISIGAFKTKNEAEACMAYIKTKFSRLLLGSLKVTQDNKKNVWSNIPQQDFTTNSDIDWCKSISQIDKQLYAKYGLTKEEIDFIDTMIKPIE